MKRSLHYTYQMNLGTICLLNRTIPKNLSTKWGAFYYNPSQHLKNTAPKNFKYPKNIQILKACDYMES